MINIKKYIVMFSTGKASAVVLDMAQRQYGKENTIALLTDTKWEDEDNYRFGNEIIKYHGANFAYRCEGRTPSEIWLQSGYLVGPAGSPCTRKLKIEQTFKYIKQQDDEVTLFFGIGKDEEHRKYNLIDRYGSSGVKCEFPLIEYPMTSAQLTSKIQNDWDIRIPRMYDLGFSHANCGGRCVKAGVKHFLRLAEVWPNRFQEISQIEQAFRDKTGGDTTILRVSRNNKMVKLPLNKLLLEYRKNVSEIELTWEQETPCECLM